MIDENYSSFTKTGPNKGNYKPDEPENHRKERQKGKEAREREKKDYQQSLVFVVWTLERQKTSAEGHSKTLSQSDLVFIHPGIYIYIFIYIHTVYMVRSQILSQSSWANRSKLCA